MKYLKNIGLLFVVAILIMSPVTILASGEDYKVSRLEKNEDLELLDQNVKYYKTVTTYDNSIYDISSQNVLNSIYNAKSVTTEITEEEYRNANDDGTISVNAYTTIETSYKIMTTNLYKNGDNFRYENILIWKKAPAVRDYDVIGIGFYGTVKPSDYFFEFKKCSVSKGCLYTAFYTPQTFTYGSSATFILPDWSDLTVMQINYYIDVEKVHPDKTVTDQAAFGDYAHSVKKVGQLQAIQHEVLQNAGIVFGDKVYDKFDEMGEADVFWEGTW